MGRQPQAKPQPESHKLELARFITQLTAAITICGLLISIGIRLAGYSYEVAKLNETQSRILQIFEKREDAGRAALQSQIERLELELKTMKPAEKRKAMEDQLISLKKRLDVSWANSKDLAGPRDYKEVR